LKSRGERDNGEVEINERKENNRTRGKEKAYIILPSAGDEICLILYTKKHLSPFVFPNPSLSLCGCHKTGQLLIQFFLFHCQEAVNAI
jgi:hypothetical protein